MIENDIKDILFSKALKEVFLSKEDKKNSLNEERIYLDNIFPLIDNKKTIQLLQQYEEQSHTLNEKRLYLFYQQGFDDALSLIKLLKNKKIV